MRTIVTSMLVLLAAGTVFSQAAPTLNHFKCYYQGVGSAVTHNQLFLEDEFDSVPQQVFTTIAARFCNPVEKTIRRRITPIVNPTHHLLMYHFDPQPIVPRDVVITNQFGHQRLSLADARILAVPTNKSEPNLDATELPLDFDPPADLNHFKCYSACGRNVRQKVLLRDQFDTDNATVLEPVLFCNPTVKIRSGLQYPIVDPEAHLTCYTITPPGTFLPTWNAGQGPFVKNQFQLNRLHDGEKVADMLCVPSLKLPDP